jgi:DNA polymerase I-like protein with 3'-5' exonuclease and polymerase domains
MLGMGEVGQLLIAWQEVAKELQFIESLYSKLDKDDIFHPQFKVPGTYTGRLSGSGGFSMQILPKTSGFLDAFRPRPGHKLVDIDVSALEPVVLTELSRDEGLLSVYGPTASPYADIYLTVGSRLGSIGQAFRDCGYDYTNPTKEAVSKCKKEHKNLRSIIKALHLACSYGAGAGKICSALQLQGIDISFDEVKAMHTAYWNMFSTIKNYERKLVSHWEKNGGWFLNGVGFPACCAQETIKDIMNRMVQGTGHTILTFLQKQIADDLAAEGIPYRPYVYDFHDELILEVPDTYAKRTYEIMDAAFQKLNKALHDGTTVVKFKGAGDVMYSLAEAKVEDYKSIWREAE